MCILQEEKQKRKESIKTFSEKSEYKIFLASEAGGLGVDGLQLVSSVVLHIELPWNPAKIDQRNGRVHRLMQLNPVDIFYVYASNTIESHMLEVLKQKRNIKEMALGILPSNE